MSAKRTHELFTTVVTRFGGKSINLLVFTLTAHFLNLAEMAVYGAVFSLTLIYSTVLDFGIRNSLAVFVGKDADMADAYTRQAFFLWLVFVPFTLPIMYFTAVQQQAGEGIAGIVIPSALLLGAMLYLRMMQGTLLGKGEIGLFNKSELASRFVLLIGTVSLLPAPKYFSLIPALWVLALSQAAAALYLFLHQKVAIGRGVGKTRALAKRLFTRGFVFMLSVLLMHVSKRASFLVVSQFSGTEDAAVFFALQRLTEVITEVGMAVSVVMFSHNVRTANGTEAARVTAQSSRLTLLVLALIGVFFAVFADWIIPLALGNQYAGNTSLFLVLLLGTLAGVIWVMLFPSMSVATSPMQVFLLMLPGSALNVVLAYAFVGQYGSLGAAWAMFVSSCITTVLFIAVYRVKFNTEFFEFFIPQRSDFSELAKRFERRR